MSQADIQALRARYDAITRGDWDEAFRNVSSDFEMKTADRVVSPGTYRGPAEVRRFFEDLLEPFEELVTVPEEFFERGNQIVVFLLLRSRPKGSSAAMEIRIGHLWTMRDGEPARLELFPERVKALEAAGLSERDAQADA